MKLPFSPLVRWSALAFILFIALVSVMVFRELTPDPMKNLPDFDEQLYREAQAANREGKNNFLRYGKDSPLPDSLKPGFTDVTYYPVDLDYRVLADWQPLADPDTIRQPDGYTMTEAGWLTFRYGGAPHRLKAFQDKSANAGKVFIPFADSTTGRSTYAGGRILDVTLLGDQAIVDFNQAYNPFCVFNYTYKCPIPPQENRLPFAVEAGEKNFHWPDSVLN